MEGFAAGVWIEEIWERCRLSVAPDLVAEWCQEGDEDVLGSRRVKREESVRELLDRKTWPDCSGW